MSCKKASYIIEKRNVAKISFLEKINLKFHLMICSLCRRYESDSKFISKLLKRLKHQHAVESSVSLTKDEKQQIKNALKSS